MATATADLPLAVGPAMTTARFLTSRSVMSSPVIPCVATLIAPEASQALEEVTSRVRAVLPRSEAPHWLDPQRAADILFTASPDHIRELRSTCLERLGAPQVDLILQPRAHRRKKLLLADMDSTMIGQECIDELADFAGLKPMVSAITERAMRGELAFEPALRERVALLKGLPVSVVDAVLRDRITLMPGGPTLVRTMRANGAYCALVSGGFTLFTAPVAARIGFDENRGNILLVENEALAGQVADPILGRDAKLATLRELRHQLNLSEAETLAIGDGANDLGMIGEAGLGVAYHAKPAVAAAATARVDHNDLTALLFVQGYERSDFVEAEA